MLKTNSKQYFANFTKYIDQCVDVEGNERATIAQKLKHAAERFKAEYCYEANMVRYPNHQDRLAQWLMGLPLSFNYSYHEIIKAAKVLHGCEIPEKTCDIIIDRWFAHCALMLMRIGIKHGVSFS